MRRGFWACGTAITNELGGTYMRSLCWTKGGGITQGSNTTRNTNKKKKDCLVRWIPTMDITKSLYFFVIWTTVYSFRTYSSSNSASCWLATALREIYTLRGCGNTRRKYLSPPKLVICSYASSVKPMFFATTRRRGAGGHVGPRTSWGLGPGIVRDLLCRYADH